MVVGNVPVKEITGPLLKKLCITIGAVRGTLHIINRKTAEVPIEESFVNPSPGKRPSPMEEAKIVDKVIQSGEPLVVTHINREEYLSGEVTSPEEFAGGEDSALVLYCLPISNGQEPSGTLTVETILHAGKNTGDDLRLLTLVASMLAQVVTRTQAAQEQVESLRRENERLQEQIKNNFKPRNMIGSSGAMRSVYLHMEQVATSANTTVLIRGESGVGKELVASAIHKGSGRTLGAFVKVNCAALPDSIIESELFGHEKGAFTGAIAMRKGRFEIADGGTIFLDEIGDISSQTQVKLLRVLQEREFERVGGQTPIKCDVRVIAATSRNLEKLIDENKFRPDLYYRLNVFPIYVPPLRERKGDILQLADHFVGKYAAVNGKNIRRLSRAAIDLLIAYGWPGNVRELENCIERAVLLCDDDTLHAHHLPPTLQSVELLPNQSGGLLEQSVGVLERDLIVNALKSTSGNMAAAARFLGITERMMTLRIKKYSIQVEIYHKSTGGAVPSLPNQAAVI